MFETFKKVFGFGPEEDFAALLQAGAQIVDVRTKEEFRSGHIPGSLNIPVHTLAANLKRISRSKPVITCCASGVRSASAKGILKANGYAEVYNGGGWAALQRKLKQQ
jgi:rhodanese-related sulfurtransferase